MLSTDGLLALLIATAAFYVVIMPHDGGYARLYARQAIARDYLDILASTNSSVTPEEFSGVALALVSNVAPASGEWLGVEKFVYPRPAGCANSSACSFSNSSSAGGYLRVQDIVSSYVNRAWVQ